MIIYDRLHEYIKLSDIAQQIIDTPQFQRLRRIHQTGCMYLVFPTATHSRFEHSIGTYHLAKQLISNIKSNQPELNITDKLVELVALSGLCHDIGHLMYSHLFDNLFLSKLELSDDLIPYLHHEMRSIAYLKYIIEKYNINLPAEDLSVIASLIEPKIENYNEWKEEYKVGRWIFEIVSNSENGIDVDKFDYTARDNQAVGLTLGFDYKRLLFQGRVINDHICYPKQVIRDIYHMYLVRYELHLRIYNHKTVKAIEILLVQILKEMENTEKISDWITNPEKILRLTDESIYFSNNDKIKSLVEKIERRQLPKLIAEYRVSGSNIDKIPKIELDSLVCEIVNYKAGYISGKNSNPLNKVYFYDPKDNNVFQISSLKDFSLLLGSEFQEIVTRIYLLDKKNNVNLKLPKGYAEVEKFNL